MPMNAAFREQTVRTLTARPARLHLAGLLLPGLLLGCDGSASSTSPGRADAKAPSTEAEQRLPTLTFPVELRTPYPQVSAFLDEFLNTCLAGDYVGYRRLVSRAFKPESRERFEAIYQATESVTVEAIEPIEIPRLPSPAYRVVSTVELDPQQQAKLRETQRKVAILVFKEGDDWRMAPAPAELQPRSQPSPATMSAPTASAPSYPWDEEGDY